MTKLRAHFIGGSLDGQSLPGVQAYYYIHDLGGGRFEEYQRTKTAYVNGDGHANESNQGRLSHLDYSYRRTAGPVTT